ncbi:MAG: sigma-70 family RNA polymerase sigma factor [Planctomycetaceae bacterium]
MPLTEKDRRIVNDLLSGKQGAWTDFVDRNSALIVQVIRHTAHAHSLRLTRDDEDDLVAETFSALLERNMAAIRAFRGGSSFATYLTVISRRITLRKLTQRRFREALGHVTAHQASVDVASSADHEHSVDAADEVESLMSSLPERSQAALRLFYGFGHSYRAIGRKLGLPVNSVGPLLSRAVASLRRKAASRS